MNPIGMTLRRSFGFLLKDVSRLNVERFEQRAGALGLTLPQCKALLYLANQEGINQVQLAERTGVEPMTLVRILDRMESDGWLERRRDPTDRRARCLYLKAECKPLVDDIWHLVDLTRREAFADIPKRQTELLIALLEKVRKNLVSLEPLPPTPLVAPQRTARGRNRAAARTRRDRAISRP